MSNGSSSSAAVNGMAFQKKTHGRTNSGSNSANSKLRIDLATEPAESVARTDSGQLENQI